LTDIRPVRRMPHRPAHIIHTRFLSLYPKQVEAQAEAEKI
jgi:hypothetical protein